MSYANIHIIYGVPLTREVSNKIKEWEDNEDERWTDTREGTCGFTNLYSASGSDMIGYCGLELDMLPTYKPCELSTLKTVPSIAEKHDVRLMVDNLHPELRELAGPIGVYFIWSDS